MLEDEDGNRIIDIGKMKERRYDYTIIGIEPDNENIKKIRMRNIDFTRVTLFEGGVSDHSGETCFEGGNQTNSMISSTGDGMVRIDTIDNILNGDRASFIKMDIEGSETEALRGAEKTNRKYKPKLAICVYHKKEDLAVIPKMIKQFDSTYRFYMRYYNICGTETVLYAI